MNVSNMMNATELWSVASMTSCRSQSPVLLVRKQAGDITSTPGCHSSFRATAPVAPPDLVTPPVHPSHHSLVHSEMSVCCVELTLTHNM